MATAAATHARLERRLSVLASLGAVGSLGGNSGATTPTSTVRSAPLSPSHSSSTTLMFTEWEDDEQQKFGTAFEFEEDENATSLLVPHTGPVGWRDADFHGSADDAEDGPFSFVDQGWFKFAVGTVIFSNALLWYGESCGFHIPLPTHAVDAAFLTIYSMELTCRIAHYRTGFFVGERDVLWNWLDFMVVLLGVLDLMFASLLRHEGGHEALLVLRVMQPVRLLCRAFRFLRYLRLLRLLLTSDLAWVESGLFQSVVGMIIILNAVVMGLETDINFGLWGVVEQIMLLFFVCELALRLRLRGWTFLTDTEDRNWNILDLGIVASGVVDQWILALWHGVADAGDFEDVGGSRQNLGKMLMLARMLRLMRILRLVRVVKAIRPLRQLAIGIVRAMQSMFWVLVLTFVALYFLAVLTTRMVGWGQMVDDPDIIPTESREMFGNIADSMFTLFAFMNGHQWHKVRPLLDLLPWTKPLFVAFTICGSWALLSVMTGVVSDHIQYVREQQGREDDEAREERRGQLTFMLSQIFAAADREGKGELSREAFMDIFSSAYQVRRLQRAVNQPLADIKYIFDWLDVDGTGYVDFREFCEGLDCLEEPVTGQRLLKVDSGVKLQCRTLQKDLDAISSELVELQKTLTDQHSDLMGHIAFACGGSQEEHAPLAPLPFSDCQASSHSVASGSDSGFPTPPSQPCSETTAVPTPPLQARLRYSRSVSSLRSADTAGSRGGFRYSKSVSFCDSVDEVAITKR
mmetsp:Transcript_49350/g.141906  ORF Transcript_49350/g.141906 Transcript_49350/m.141906 type:complete len:747 (+) Transcript_49350:1-2241(+)